MTKNEMRGQKICGLEEKPFLNRCEAGVARRSNPDTSIPFLTAGPPYASYIVPYALFKYGGWTSAYRISEVQPQTR